MSEVRCPWCVQTGFACKGAEVCDFKSLPKRKDAIVKRVQREVDECKTLRAKMGVAGFLRKPKAEQERLVRRLLDLLFGVAKMCEALERECGMSREQVRSVVGGEKMDVAEKLRLVVELKKMRRGSK